jgi:hypothetical protein
MSDNQTVRGGSAGDPADAPAVTGTGGCCGNPATATQAPPEPASGTCCGTQAEAAADNSCCGATAKTEAVAAGQGCCG